MCKKTSHIGIHTGRQSHHPFLASRVDERVARLSIIVRMHGAMSVVEIRKAPNEVPMHVMVTRVSHYHDVGLGSERVRGKNV